MAFLPIKTTARGPAPPAKADEKDIIDEAIETFKANVMFRNFEIKGSGDRVLCYLTLYVTHCLNALTKATNKNDAQKKLQTLALENFSIPGDSNFVFAGLYPNPDSRADAGIILFIFYLLLLLLLLFFFFFFKFDWNLFFYFILFFTIISMSRYFILLFYFYG